MTHRKRKGKASLAGVAKLQAEKKAKIEEKRAVPNTTANKAKRKAIQAEVDALTRARTVMAREVKRSMEETSSWAMGRNSNPIGICTLYR